MPTPISKTVFEIGVGIVYGTACFSSSFARNHRAHFLSGSCRTLRTSPLGVEIYCRAWVRAGCVVFMWRVSCLVAGMHCHNG